MFCARNRFARLPRRCSSSRGYTLIEVLIASAIFAAMVTLATMALDQGLKQYQGLMERGLNFWDYARYLWIERSFDSAADYYIYSRPEGWTPYFVGDQEGISYVSLAPLAGDLPVVVWIKKEQESDGRYTLSYYELPVYTKSYVDIERDAVFSDYKKGTSIKLLEGLERLEVSFYGYDFALRKEQWSREYDARKRKLLPLLVKFEYASQSHKNVLVFGMNVNSTIKMNYNETYPGL